MSIGMIIFIIILFIITLVLTLYVLKLEENKMKKYEEEEDSVKDELRRSHEYESKSLRTSLAVQVWFYIGMVILFIVSFVIYLKVIQ